MQFLQLDLTGVYVVGHGVGPVLPSGAIPLPNGKTPSECAGCYLSGGVLVSRPASPSPVAVDGGWRVDLPAGGTVEVYDVSGSEVLAREDVVAGGAYEFALPDTGRYQVTVTAPLPAIPVKTVIEVS